ncbi:MAG: hypothetical protein IPK50_06995 [Fibrobacterota bacterium]|nr:hypothetical protein [Fibrobacterota bacterium]QQS06640.1 MAG: hypothetical protein IPK50_06995 [Fibrobacterota bacterium]
MRYFGESSLSSVLHRLLPFASGFILVVWFVFSLLLGFALFPRSWGDPFTQGIAEQSRSPEALSDPEWANLVAMPAYVRALVFPYFALVVLLLLAVLHKARALFSNFRKSIVFHPQNTSTIRSITYLLIPFSVLSMNFPSLLVSLILLLVAEILRSGSVLQEEHDMTV